MNARRVPFEAPKERSRVCIGGFRPKKHVGGHGLYPVGLYFPVILLRKKLDRIFRNRKIMEQYFVLRNASLCE
jgi:hypothetical protein